MAEGLVLEQNGSPAWKDHLVLLYYFYHAINPLILTWRLGNVTWSSVSHFPWDLLQPLRAPAPLQSVLGRGNDSEYGSSRELCWGLEVN